MARFRFRLQRVLDFRRKMEDAAKLAFLEARALHVAAEAETARIDRRISEALCGSPEGFEGRLELEAYLSKLDDDRRAQDVIVSMLIDEEEAARTRWLESKQEAEAIEKLREKAWDEFQVEVSRSEIAELDEWSILRRRPA